MRGRSSWWLPVSLTALSVLAGGCDPSAWFGGGDAATSSADSDAGKSPAKPEAEPVAELDDAEAPPEHEALKADLATSKIGFAVAKATSEHVAVFEDFSAEAALTKGEPTRLDITIQMASLRSDREGLTKHLQSAEFFDVDKYPTSSFSAATFRASPGEGRTHELTGKLSLHGVERTITFPAEIHVEKKRATGHAELTIDPRDYGIEHPALREELVDTNVLLEIDLGFPRASGKN